MIAAAVLDRTLTFRDGDDDAIMAIGKGELTRQSAVCLSIAGQIQHQVFLLTGWGKAVLRRRIQQDLACRAGAFATAIGPQTANSCGSPSFHDTPPSGELSGYFVSIGLDKGDGRHLIIPEKD